MGPPIAVVMSVGIRQSPRPACGGEVGSRGFKRGSPGEGQHLAAGRRGRRSIGREPLTPALSRKAGAREENGLGAVQPSADPVHPEDWSLWPARPARVMPARPPRFHAVDGTARHDDCAAALLDALVEHVSCRASATPPGCRHSFSAASAKLWAISALGRTQDDPSLALALGPAPRGSSHPAMPTESSHREISTDLDDDPPLRRLAVDRLAQLLVDRFTVLTAASQDPRHRSSRAARVCAAQEIASP